MRLPTLLLFVLFLSPVQARAADSLDIKIGAMIMTGFRGLKPTEEIRSLLQKQHIGGVILFDYDVELKKPVRNIASKTQLTALIRELRGISGRQLLVAIDQEGGRVSRLKERYGFPPTVSQQELGDFGDTARTAAEARSTARLLRSMGIDINFAPVVDVNVNPANPVIGKLQRSYSADAGQVASHARAAMLAMRSEHVTPVPKHFPGHGSSAGDTHEGFVDVTATWRKPELLPYRALVKEGIADMIMTAHIVNRTLDPALPATLSSKVISELLRTEMGFDGVVVSDDMQMKAIAGEYGFEQSLLLAVNAGVDILLFGNNTGTYEEGIAARAHAVLKRMVADGRISLQRVDQSWLRIRMLHRRGGTP